MSIRRSALTFAVVFVLTPVVGLHADQIPPEREEVQLLLAVSRPEPVYPLEGERHTGYIAFAGEPLRLRVTIVNRTASTIVASDGWLHSLRVSFETPTRQLVTESVPYRLVRVVGRRPVQQIASSLEAGASQEVLLEIISANLPVPGRYRVSAAVARNSLSGGPAGAVWTLTAWDFLDIRPIVSRFDELNVLHGSAIRERLDGDLIQAGAALQALLERQPNSFVAWHELAVTRLQQGDCSGARAALVSARRLSGLDINPDEVSAKHRLREQALASLEREIERCGGP